MQKCPECNKSTRQLLKKLNDFESYGYYYNNGKYDNPLDNSSFVVNCKDNVEEHMNNQQLVDYHNYLSCCINGDAFSEVECCVLEAERDRIFKIIESRLNDKS